ncbi:MAG: glycosyltransferase family 2 protein [Candidatus Methanoperedens sp.]
MKVSIIIPTHNRANSLKKTIESIVEIRNEADIELIVVDNNSTDNTKNIIESYSDIAHYVFEENTSFTKARETGAKNSKGDILLYLDDDVIVHPGSLKEITSIFGNYLDCGVIAGKILPQYEESPPDWALACQRSFNGWSLYNSEEMPHLGIGFQEVTWAAGPMMAIRKDAYIKVGGFPPDTIGVETNNQTRTFRKLYIGPGDVGLCEKIRNFGYKVYYSPNISCCHIISKIRFTVPFWRSRVIGEAQYNAITNREFRKLSKWKLWKEHIKSKHMYNGWKKRLITRLKANEAFMLQTNFSGMLFEELWLQYYRSYIEMDKILNKYPDLSELLWDIGLNGVSDSEFEEVITKFPSDYIKLIESEKMHSEEPIISIDALNSFGF